MFKERSKRGASMGRPEWAAGREERQGKSKHSRDWEQMECAEGIESRPGSWRAERRDLWGEAGVRQQVGHPECWARCVSRGDCFGKVDNAQAPLIL